ncbi:hypothetical protein [Caulobacter sp. DWR2-3-1b2]|uniref:hypothetical protein n=1 Tax=unclassified Caulobacter TaxID=2648921 RepID=UPI003CEF2315
MENELKQDRGAFEPSDASVDVRFVKGNEGFSSIPEIVALSGLNERFAVIQETAVEGCSDWYFDKLLWRCLVTYLAERGGQVTVLVQWRGTDEVPIDEYIGPWERIEPQDQEPPWALLVRIDGRLTLSMVTEYWCLVGGPIPYHDSYTYSLFSQRDVSEEVLLAIKGSPAVRRWHLQEDVIGVSPENSRSSPVERSPRWSLISWLRGRRKARSSILGA